MKITTKKTTRITTSITWRNVLCDDNGEPFAAMNGTLDATAPFGSTSLSVLNRGLFEKNKEAAAAAYADFKAQIEKAAEETTPTSTVVEGDGQTVTGNNADEEGGV